jgi:hypothetical protein
MRKQLLNETPELDLSEEQIATEMVELTCDEVDALTRAFTMIAALCEDLQREVSEDTKLDVPENLIN